MFDVDGCVQRDRFMSGAATDPPTAPVQHSQQKTANVVRALAIQKLDSLKVWCPRRWTKPNAMRNRGDCVDAVERAHTKSLDANDKLI